MPSPGPRGNALRSLLAGAAASAVALGAGLALLAMALADAGGLGAGFVAKALGVFAAGAALALAALPAHLPHRRFGPANQVTLARLALAALLAAMLGEPVAALAWPIVALAAAAAALDAVDGPLARASALASRFGARFDMETDAFLMLALAALAWQLGKAGAWILLAGLLRYLFVAAGRALGWLARPLPPSLRRKAACVAQIVALVVALVPSVPHPASAALAGAGLALLAYSFAVDVVWLRRRAGDPLMETAA